MLLISIIIVILFLTVLFALFYRNLMIIRINGESMYPTYKDGQYRLVDKKFNTHYRDFKKLSGLEGRIFVMWSPDGVPIIKRLKYVSDTPVPEYWVEGDNPEQSMDSRQYGFLKAEGFIGEVVSGRVAIKRLFRL